jgi:hypothetical protein
VVAWRIKREAKLSARIALKIDSLSRNQSEASICWRSLWEVLCFYGLSEHFAARGRQDVLQTGIKSLEPAMIG